MGDDPYDFEIAIPSGGSGKAKSYSSRRHAGSSDDGGGSSDVSISTSDEEDEDEDEDEESVDARKPKITPKQQQAQPTSGRGAAGTTATASSSTSALDKAKNFLSKYSTKAVDTKSNKAQASSRSSRRVELSFDDSMDFSKDGADEESEGEEEQQRSSKPRQAKTTTKSASIPAAKRVTLSDSEDYGVADSDEEQEPRKAKSAASAAQQLSTRAKKQQSQSDDDSDDDTPLTRAATIEVTKPTTPAITTNRSVDSNYEDEEEDVVASSMDESEEGDPPPFSAVSSFKTSAAAPAVTKIEPKPTITSQASSSKPSSSKYGNATASNDDDDPEEESIASKSDYVESFEEEDFPTHPTPSVAASAPKSAVSESGAYEEEDFDEESGITLSAPVPNRVVATVQSTSQLEDSSKVEPNFDYSMDFSDDNGGGGKLDEIKPTAFAVLSIPEARAQPTHEEASPSSSNKSHESDQQEQSDFLDSDGSNRDEVESEPSHPPQHHAEYIEESRTSLLHHASNPSKFDHVEATDATAPPLAVTAQRARFDADAYVDNGERHDRVLEPIISHAALEEPSLAATRLEPQIPVSAHLKTHSEGSQPLPFPVQTTSTTRSRVLIVREYEQPFREQVEMRDASTQFTGNHAGIQADLTPDGMHSLFADTSPQTPGVPLPFPPAQHHSMSQQSTQNPERDQSCQPADAYPHAAAPPPPPAPSMLSSPGYSMDVLRLPTATTTSIYKQQLQALQEQILVKKRETERLVQERMVFQYSTLRGTERVSLVIAVETPLTLAVKHPQNEQHLTLHFLNSWYAEEVYLIKSTRKAGAVAGSHAC